MFFQFMEGGEETDRIRVPGACKTKEDEDIGFQPGVITGKLEKGIVEGIFIQIAVPS